MALACQHGDRPCHPGCHNYRLPFQALEERTANRMARLADEMQECEMTLNAITQVRESRTTKDEGRKR